MHESIISGIKVGTLIRDTKHFVNTLQSSQRVSRRKTRVESRQLMRGGAQSVTVTVRDSETVRVHPRRESWVPLESD